jgi:hypothetical protein
MSNALFLPRELFAPAPAASAATATRPQRRSAQFTSGEAVAADLLNGWAPIEMQAPTERRRKPRAASARGVDLFIA